MKSFFFDEQGKLRKGWQMRALLAVAAALLVAYLFLLIAVRVFFHGTAIC
ncbi:hypothetical protein [Janthinobacterium sp.]|nr:hypothetical protein [Janthinobacterium sp.]